MYLSSFANIVYYPSVTNGQCDCSDRRETQLHDLLISLSIPALKLCLYSCTVIQFITNRHELKIHPFLITCNVICQE